jgi:hypothetical protein
MVCSRINFTVFIGGLMEYDAHRPFCVYSVSIFSACSSILLLSLIKFCSRVDRS